MSIWAVLIIGIVVAAFLALRKWIFGKLQERAVIETALILLLNLLFYCFVFKRKPSVSISFDLEAVKAALYLTFLCETFYSWFLAAKQQVLKPLLETETLKKYLACACFIISICLSLELSLFNFRHLQTFLNTPSVILNYEPGYGMEIADSNAFEVVDVSEAPYVEIKDINMKVNNLYMDITYANLGEFAVRDTRYHLEIVDDGNANYYKIPGRRFMRQIQQTHYNMLNLYGNCHSMKLVFDNVRVGDIIRLNDLQFNVVYPYLISIKRTLFLIAALLLFFLVRPKSFLWNITFEQKIKNRKLYFILYFIMMSVLFFHVVNKNTAFKSTEELSMKQFSLLAEALAEGKSYLLEEPSPLLATMDDPYDYHERLKTVEDDDMLWDTAYYKGHYYVYFGVGPIITIYLPYYLLTGTHIATYLVVYLCAVFVIAGMMWLLYEIAKKWMGTIPLLLYFMFTTLSLLGCGAFYLMTKADIYAVPMMMGLMNVLAGLAFWMNAIRTKKYVAVKLFMGSFCMAFVAACRPQFLLGSFLAILLFWEMVFKERELFSKKSIGKTICFVVPYIVIAGFVMYYNYIRFESPFDFGANYNLTFNNMPYRGVRLDRVLYGTIGYLFFPCSVTNRFPYYGLCNYVPRFQGIEVDDKIFGGIIYNNIYLILTLFAFKFKKVIHDKKAYLLAVITPAMGILVMLVDSNMAGTLTRYWMDFNWLFMLSAFIILGFLFQAFYKGPYEVCYKYAFVGCFIFIVIRSWLSIYAGEGNLELGNTLLFCRVAHLVEFWN